MTSSETSKGNVAELKFAYEAKRRGWNVSFPQGSDSSYDCIIEAGGITKRIQVKSSMTKENGRDCYKINATYGSDRSRRYTKAECDTVAVYVGDVDSFYLIPIECLKSATIRVYPHRPAMVDGYEIFYEDWKGLVG